MKRTPLHSLLTKFSSYADFSRHNVQSLLPISERRELSPEENREIRHGDEQWIPKIFESLNDSPAVRMANPGAQAALWGGGIGLPAAALIGSATDSAPAGLVGGAALGGLASLLAFYRRRQKNEDIREIMQRLPEGANLRDFEADPIMAERRMAALMRQQNTGAGLRVGF